MLVFKSAEFFESLENLSMIEMWLPSDPKDKDYEKRHSDVLSDFDDVIKACQAIDMGEAVKSAVRKKAYAEEHKENPIGIQALGRDLVRNVQERLESRVFLHVREQHGDYIDNDKLFGPAVHGQFPAARPDIREAGNCLAADCATAAVFHLMRAAEVALRALALDRSVVFPRGDLARIIHEGADFGRRA